MRTPLPRIQALLLHGTDPRNLHRILFEGLDPGLADGGLFDSGTYFAESECKVNPVCEMQL